MLRAEYPDEPDADAYRDDEMSVGDLSPDERHFADADEDPIVRTLDLLCPDAPVAVAALNRNDWMEYRYFDRHVDASAWAQQRPRTDKAAYVVMNPYVKTSGGKGIADDDITRRRWLLIDCDPTRDTGSNATDWELGHARDVAGKIRAYLTSRGWPEPIAADSGNGAHLLYAIDLPSDKTATALVEGILKHLKDFNTPGVKVDQAVGNASRITKLYGTMVRKGPATPARPQRLSALTSIPAVIDVVPRAALEQLGGTTPKAEKPKSKGTGLYDRDAILAKLDVFSTTDRSDYTEYQIRCPWSAEHSDPDSRHGTIFTWSHTGAPGFKCPHSHCADRRWDAFRHHLGLRQTGAEVIEEIAPNEIAQPVSVPYVFDPAFGPGHFVTQWIEHFSAQSDAALEYHEAAALVALSAVTHGLGWRLSGAIGPLRTNLYVVLLGPSTTSRKSSVKDYAVELIKRLADRCAVLPEMASVEGMVEALSEAPRSAALMPIDEVKPLLDKLTHAQHLAGFKGLILELYGRTSYEYKRASKRKKSKDGGSERVEDALRVDDVTLSILGCGTETVFDSLSSEIIESGLMPRFAVVWPTGKPARLPRYEMDATHEPTALLARLHEIGERLKDATVTAPRDVLGLLDQEIDLPLERDTDAGLMVKRLPDIAKKVAMLAAAGRPDAYFGGVLTITVEDARAAITVVRRWIAGAKRFEARLGESQFERKVERCLQMVRGRQGHVNRRDIARKVRLTAREMRDVEETLKQRERIEVVSQQHPAGGAPKVFWRWLAD